jgi:hypothetical protein
MTHIHLSVLLKKNIAMSKCRTASQSSTWSITMVRCNVGIHFVSGGICKLLLTDFFIIPSLPLHNLKIDKNVYSVEIVKDGPCGRKDKRTGVIQYTRKNRSSFFLLDSSVFRIRDYIELYIWLISIYRYY